MLVRARFPCLAKSMSSPIIASSTLRKTAILYGESTAISLKRLRAIVSVWAGDALELLDQHADRYQGGR